VLQPVGPLPPQVYWRRRLVLLGGALVVVLLAVAMCSLGGSSGGSPRGQGTGSPGGGSVRGSATPTPSVTSGGAATTITPSPGTAGGPAQGDHPSGSGTPTGSGGTDGSGQGGGGTGSGGGTGGGDGTQPAGPPQACPDSALDVTASSAEPSYRVGETPVLRLAVRNVGAVACVRDVGPRQQEMLMYDGSKRVWSSNDCYPDGGTDIRTLDPGETITSTVVWSGLGSQPGCAGKRNRVPAGSYQVTGRVGDVHSKPATLVLR
jgi:hypothetical protein